MGWPDGYVSIALNYPGLFRINPPEFFNRFKNRELFYPLSIIFNCIGELMTEQNGVANLFTVTEVELVYRNKQRASDRRQIISSKDAHELLIMSWDMNKIELLEQFKIILLDRRNSCLGISNVSAGGITSCVVDPKIVYSIALRARATEIILAHNHPSGNLNPSNADIDLTKKLKEGGKFLEINVLDHLILTKENYFSFGDNGIAPF